jgi:hypothetical protein
MKGQKDFASLGIPSLETDALVISDVADHPALSPSRRSSSEKSVDRMELSCEEDDSRKAQDVMDCLSGLFAQSESQDGKSA